MVSLIKAAFRNHPMLANSTSYGTLCIGAEFTQQLLDKRILVKYSGQIYKFTDEKLKIRLQNKDDSPSPFDKESLGRYAVIGFCINPNMLYFWYKWLDKKYIGTSVKIVARKVLMDQFLMTPLMYMIFYTSMSLMERKQDIFQELRIKFLPTFKVSCLFWLPVQTVNFLFVPNIGRIVYIGTSSFIWLNILAYIKNK